jgi:hypothetical protein
MIWVAVGGIPAAVASAILPADVDDLTRVGFAVAGALVGTLLVLTALFVWAFVTARHHQLEDRVIEIEDGVKELAVLVRPDTSALRLAFRSLSDETQDNCRLMKSALEQGRYWQLTAKSPDTKQWKKYRKLLAGERAYEGLYSSGRAVADEVDRVTQARAVRAFRRDPKVKDEDRLPDVISMLEDFERELVAAMDGLRD